MEYLIPAVVVLLLIAGLVTFLVLNATKKSGPAAGRLTEEDTTGRQPERREPEDERPRSERLANRDA